MPYTINGQAASISSEPQMKDDTMWVPLRGLGEALGGSVSWDESSNSAILQLNGHSVSVTSGSDIVTMDGAQTQIQGAPYEDSNELWVPVRFFNNPLGYGLGVDLSSNSVEVTPPA